MPVIKTRVVQAISLLVMMAILVIGAKQIIYVGTVGNNTIYAFLIWHTCLLYARLLEL